jgi:hypothetical protein
MSSSRKAQFHKALTSEIDSHGLTDFMENKNFKNTNEMARQWCTNKPFL